MEKCMDLSYFSLDTFMLFKAELYELKLRSSKIVGCNVLDGNGESTEAKTGSYQAASLYSWIEALVTRVHSCPILLIEISACARTTIQDFKRKKKLGSYIWVNI